MGKVFTTMNEEYQCPICQSTLNKVPYFLGAVRGKNVQSDLNYKTTTTTYSNVIKKQGGICINCGHKKYKSRRTIGLPMFLLGFVLLFVPIIIMTTKGMQLDRSLSEALAFLSMIGLPILIIGVGFLISGSNYKWFKRPEKLVV